MLYVVTVPSPHSRGQLHLCQFLLLLAWVWATDSCFYPIKPIPFWIQQQGGMSTQPEYAEKWLLSVLAGAVWGARDIQISVLCLSVCISTPRCPH